MFLLYCSVIVNALSIAGTTSTFSLEHTPQFALNNLIFVTRNLFQHTARNLHKYREALCLRLYSQKIGKS